MAVKLSLEKIKKLAEELIPKDGHIWLYGSRARGDFREDSDWDLLILLNKDKTNSKDYADIAYPFEVMGWKYDTAVSPQIYTYSDWSKRSFTPFYKNVEHDKLLIV